MPGKLAGLFPRPTPTRADGGYAGKPIGRTRERGGWAREIVKRCDGVKGFKVLPKRWIVERTFAWPGRYRRHGKDYEMLPDSSEAMTRVSMINLMVHRLSPG